MWLYSKETKKTLEKFRNSMEKARNLEHLTLPPEDRRACQLPAAAELSIFSVHINSRFCLSLPKCVYS